MSGHSTHDNSVIDTSDVLRRVLMDRMQGDTWLRSLVDESPFGISISRNGIILYVNRVCTRLFGTSSPIEHVGTSQLSRVAPESRDTVAGYIRRREQGEDAPRAYEIMRLRKDGTVIPLYVEVSRVRLMGQMLSVAFFTDFTERRRMEEDLRKAHEELELRVRKRTRELVELTETLKTNEAELQSRTARLEELNRELRTLMDQRDRDRHDLKEHVLANIGEHIMPAIGKLRACGLTKEAAAHLDGLESHLGEIVSPFNQHVADARSNLSHTEIRIINMIKQGLRSKEIAETMKLSRGTIDFCRKGIRKKIGICNTRVHLRNHLSSQS